MDKINKNNLDNGENGNKILDLIKLKKQTKINSNLSINEKQNIDEIIKDVIKNNIGILICNNNEEDGETNIDMVIGAVLFGEGGLNCFDDEEKKDEVSDYIISLSSNIYKEISSLGSIYIKKEINSLELQLDKTMDNPNNLANFDERKKILEEKHGFTCSDLDNYQFFKKFKDDAYLYLTITKDSYSSEYIDLSMYSSNEQIEESTGTTLSYLKECYPNEDFYKQMVIENIYENEYESGIMDDSPVLNAVDERINSYLDDTQKKTIHQIAKDIINSQHDNEIVMEEIIEKQDYDRLITEVIDTINQDIQDNPNESSCIQEGFNYPVTYITNNNIETLLENMETMRDISEDEIFNFIDRLNSMLSYKFEKYGVFDLKPTFYLSETTKNCIEDLNGNKLENLNLLTLREGLITDEGKKYVRDLFDKVSVFAKGNIPNEKELQEKEIRDYLTSMKPLISIDEIDKASRSIHITKEDALDFLQNNIYYSNILESAEEIEKRKGIESLKDIKNSTLALLCEDYRYLDDENEVEINIL